MRLFKPFSVEEVSRYTEAKIVSKSNQVKELEYLFYDSRKIYSTTTNSIFVAIHSNSNDGHKYLNLAYKKGVKCFLVSSLPNEIEEDATYLLVDNPIKALQDWAKAYRETFVSTVVAITGSNGKTIVKEWLYQLLSAKISIGRSPLSFNSQLGVPISVLLASDKAKTNVFELGISEANEMDSLDRIIQPNIAVLTSFGTAHREGFSSREEHLKEKLKLFRSSSIWVLPGDDASIVEEAKRVSNQINPSIITFGSKSTNTVFVASSNEFDWGFELILSINRKEHKLKIPFKDEASILNIVCVFAILYALGLQPEEFTSSTNTLSKVEMRLETLSGINNSILINDSFNSDLTSLHTAIDTLYKYNNKTKHLVLSDFHTPNPTKDYSFVAERINQAGIDRLYLVGKEINNYANLFTNFCVGVDKVEDLLKAKYWNLTSKDVVLIKGSRSFGLNVLSDYLQKNSHDTTVEINLEKLISNVKSFKSFLSPNTKLMCMVKAFSYGIGDAEISQSIQSQGVEYFGVAYAQEGVDLRNRDINKPIMVMNPEASSYSQVIDYELEPEIYSFRVLKLFTEKLNSKGISYPYPIHIKLNTGMNRLGFSPNDLNDLIEILNKSPQLKVVSVLSHFASADDDSQKAFTINQAEKLSSFHNSISSALGYPIMKHICNSSAIINYPEFHFDMVRLGIGMYGYGLNPSSNPKLEPVFKLRTLISQIHSLEPNESIGYGRSFVSDKPIRIAVLPIGYADGINRQLSNGVAKFLINNQWAQSVGRICMDMLMVDVTHIDCIEGDEVCFFEEPYGVNFYAEKLNTIPYELITSLSYRLKRIYFHG